MTGGSLVWLFAIGSIVPATEPLSLPKPGWGEEQPPTLLVLTGGQIFSGAMSQRPEGYMVQTANGEVLVPYDMVRAAAASLPEAYAKMRDNLVNPTANDRLNLAQWCLNQNLVEEARQEVLAALRLEPERKEARRLLQEIESRLAKAGAAQPSRRSEEPVSPPLGLLQRQWDNPLGPGPLPVSDAGLSRESVAEFNRQVQPLLLNRCGNARCHGSAAENDLRLAPISATRNNRFESERNLSAVLRYIESGRPDESPLLLRSGENSGSHRDLFTGSRYQPQRELLIAWVRRVSAEVKPTAPHKLARTAPPTLLRPIETAPAPDRSQPATANRAAATMNHVDEQFLQRILHQEQPDAFDPDEFNRLVHGFEANQARANGESPSTRGATDLPGQPRMHTNGRE